MRTNLHCIEESVKNEVSTMKVQCKDNILNELNGDRIVDTNRYHVLPNRNSI